MIVDADLWRSVQFGDATAFAQVYERHADAVYRYCFRRTGNWADAEDLTAMVFLQAWNARDSVVVDDRAGLRPWLYGVALNTMRNRARATRRESAFLARLTAQSLGSAVVVPDTADEAAARVDDEVLMRRVLAAMARLSRGDREVLALCVWEDLTPSQAGIALGVPSGVVRSRLSRARRRLREALPGLDSSEAPA